MLLVEKCYIRENKYDEIPLHTAVLKKLNYHIVKYLIENGSEIHNINIYGETVVKTLMKNHKSLRKKLYVLTYKENIMKI